VLHSLAVLCSGIESEQGRKEAQAFYKRALDLRKALCRRRDATRQDHGDLARTHGHLGDLLLEMGDLAGADAAYWESHRIRERLFKEDKESDDARFQLARSFGNFANYQTRVRALDTAINFLEQALEHRRDLVRDNPAVTEYQTDLADGCHDIAELLLLRAGKGDTERRDRALKLAQESEALYRRQQKNDEQAITVRRGLAESLALRARLLADSWPDEARTLLIESEVLFKKVLEQMKSADTHYQLAGVHALQAELAPAASREGHIKDALAELRTAFEMHFRRLHPDDVKRDRAFKVLRERSEFKQILAGR
jgi:tetratricopeptide (TPR) repeat protein